MLPWVKVPALKAWWSKFNPQNPGKVGRREPTPQSPAGLTSTQAQAHGGMLTPTHILHTE